MFFFVTCLYLHILPSCAALAAYSHVSFLVLAGLVVQVFIYIWF
jgi:hypothetical protein